MSIIEIRSLCKDYKVNKEIFTALNNVNLTVDTDKCSLYYAKVIKDIKIKKSPDWLISRLIAFGIRPINNAVDITNYILALFGQP